MQSSQVNSAVILTCVIVLILAGGTWFFIPQRNHLIEAVEQRDKELARALIESGHPLNGLSEDGYTALAVAVSYGEVEIARMLIQAGADVNEPRRGREWTPLHIAVSHRQEMIEDILSAGIDVNFYKNRMALERAVRMGNTEVVRMLLNAGMPTAALDPKQMSPREIAEQKGYDEIVDLLNASSR